MIAILIVFMAERETRQSFELREMYLHGTSHSCISIVDIFE